MLVRRQDFALLRSVRRIALTIAQEPGGGGAAAWRVTETLEGERETLSRTTQTWYRPEFFQFGNNDVVLLPYDHHELMTMVAPRALLVLGHPDIDWLAAESGHVSSMAAQEVWEALGISDRFGFSIVGGHNHCQLPDSQRPEVEAFVDKFLLGDESTTTDIATSPYDPDLSPWITWETPELVEGATSIDDAETDIAPPGLPQNYPNPFRAATTITYTVERPAHVELTIYNALGQRVNTVADGVKSRGTYSVRWDGKDDAGTALPSGMYFYTIRVGERQSTKVMTYFR